MFAFGDASKKNRVRGVPRTYRLPRYQYAAPASMDRIAAPLWNSSAIRANVVPAPGMPGNELEGIPEPNWGGQNPNNPVTGPAPVIQEPPFYVTVPGFGAHGGKPRGGVRVF